jgi:hypothetical protein
MGLKSDHEFLSKDEWMAIATDGDPKARRRISTVLREDLGIDPSEYMSWDASDRVAKIMEAQAAAGGGSETPTKKAASQKASTKKAAVSSASSEDVGGGGLDAKTKARIEKMELQLDDLQETNAALLAYQYDMHMLVRILVQSDKKLRENSMDEEIQEALYGKLVVEPAGND